MAEQDGETLLTPGEVAELFGVDPKTVSRWADAGKLRAQRTLGGHRRYRAEEVERLLASARGDVVPAGGSGEAAASGAPADTDATD